MNTKTNLSVAIATYNEEANIAKCLDAVVDWVDEIVVVDGQSSDSTPEIVQKYPKTKLISTNNKPIFHINKQMAIDACTSPWILQLDADEIVTPQLQKEILDITTSEIKDSTPAGFWIPRKNYFLGSFLTKGGVYPDPTIRLYQKGKAYLPCKDVHEQAQVDGQVGQIKNDLEHYADPSFSRYLLRANRYTTLLAKEYQDKNIPLNAFNFINYYFFKPIYWFILAYFRHRGYVDGFPGFVFAFFSALRFPISYTKYWELTKTSTNINLAKDWDK